MAAKMGVQGAGNPQTEASEKGPRRVQNPSDRSSHFSRLRFARIIQFAFNPVEWAQLLSDQQFQGALRSATRLDQAETVIRVGLEQLDTRLRAQEAARRQLELVQSVQRSLSQRLAQLTELQVNETCRPEPAAIAGRTQLALA